MEKSYGKDNPTFVDDSGIVVKKPKEHSTIDVDESENSRGNWGNGLEFLFSCIAMSVGLGKIIKFFRYVKKVIFKFKFSHRQFMAISIHR
jgi:hypothetical protein